MLIKFGLRIFNSEYIYIFFFWNNNRINLLLMKRLKLIQNKFLSTSIIEIHEMVFSYASIQFSHSGIDTVLFSLSTDDFLW